MTRIRWWLLLATIAILVAGTGVTWLLATEAGLVRAVALLESIDQPRIRISGAHGRLIGPLRADSVVIENATAKISITGLEADYEPVAIIGGRISAEHVRAASVAIELREHTGPRGPPAFMPRWLSLAIVDFAVGHLAIHSSHGTETKLRDASGSFVVAHSRIRFRDAAADAGAWAVTGAAGQVFARRPLAIKASAGWSLTSAHELTGTAQASGDLDRLLVKAQLSAPASGVADLELTRLTDELRWSGKAVVSSLDLSRWFRPPPFGPLRAELDGHGDRSNYVVAGLVRGDGLPSSGVAMDGVASYADSVLSVHELSLAAAPSGSLRLQGAVTVGEVPALDLRAEWSGLAWPLAGPALFRSSSGSLEAQGWREFSYLISGRIEPRGAPPAAGRAEGRLTSTQLIVQQSSFEALGGRVEAQGMLLRSPDHAWTMTGRAQGIDPATLRKDLPGSLAFSFAASGSGLERDARWAAAVSGLSGRFRGQPVSGGGVMLRQQARIRFERVKVAVGPARLQLDGSFGQDPLLKGRLAAGDLSSFLPELGGSVDAELDVRGPKLDFSLRGRDLAWERNRVASLSVDAKIDLADRESSSLQLHATSLELGGRSLPEARLSFDGFQRDHRVAFRADTGKDAVELLGNGSYLNRSYTLQSAGASAQGPEAPAYRLEPLIRLVVAADHAELAPACLVNGEIQVCAEGGWRRDSNWWFHGHTRSLPLEALGLAAPAGPRYRGLLFVDARAHAQAGQPWLADVEAEIRDAAFRHRSASGEEHDIQLGPIQLALHSDPGHHRLNLRLVDSEHADLAAELVAERVANAGIGEAPITGHVHGASRQLDLLPLLFEDIDRATGSLGVDLAVTGRLAAPELEGEARLADGSLDFYQTNLRLRDVEATATLRHTGLGLRASASAGGQPLEVDARLDWQQRHLQGVLTMKGERLLLVDVPEARILASPDLRLALDGRRIAVTGSITVPEARIAPAEISGAVFPSLDERIVHPEQQSGGETPLEVVTDVRLTLGDKVHLDAFGLSGRITGSMRTRSEPREAAVASGELEIEDGEYRAYTRELEVERGRLLFTGGPVTDPGVDLRATRRLPGTTVGVLARGRLRQPQLTLFSEPPLPQTQIASLLIVGRTLDSLQGQDQQELAAERPDLYSQGGALLAAQLGRYVGLDEAGVEQGEDARTALVLGKFLSPRLYVSYGISLVDEINTFKLRYTIGDRWVIAAETGLNSAADFEYSIEH